MGLDAVGRRAMGSLAEGTLAFETAVEGREAVGGGGGFFVGFELLDGVVAFVVWGYALRAVDAAVGAGADEAGKGIAGCELAFGGVGSGWGGHCDGGTRDGWDVEECSVSYEEG